MGTIASQIASLTIVYSTVYSDADQRKNQSSASLAFVRGIHRGPVNSAHKWPVARKMFPFDDVIMTYYKRVTTCWTYNFQTTKVITLRWPIPCWMNNTIQFIKNRHLSFDIEYHIQSYNHQNGKFPCSLLCLLMGRGEALQGLAHFHNWAIKILFLSTRADFRGGAHRATPPPHPLNYLSNTIFIIILYNGA